MDVVGVGRSRFDSPLPSSDDESLPTSTQLPFSGDDEDWPEDKSPSPVPGNNPHFLSKSLTVVVQKSRPCLITTQH